MDMLVLFGSMILFFFIGVPVGVAVGTSCFLTMILFSDLPMVLIAQNCFAGIDSFPLMAVPFFILAGVLMGTGGIARRLMDCVAVLVGTITGGLAIVSTITSMFFGAISGSAVASVSAIGTIMIPEMVKKGYDKGFSAALAAASGTIGVIIPPSVPLVIYGVATNTSIGDLFLAGLFPGILMGLGLSITSYGMSKKRGYVGTGKSVNIKDPLRIVWDSKLALLSPIIVLGGIYSGIFTPTEASVVSVVYSLLVGKFAYKELSVRMVYDAILNASVISAVTMFLIGFSTTFATYINLAQIPQKIAATMVGMTDNAIVMLLIINIFLLFVGMLIDNIPAVLILAPIFLPIVKSYGISPIHFGIIMTMNLAIGFVTPPLDYL
jgi:tripartite ATP-independent transporter DctM subunit